MIAAILLFCISIIALVGGAKLLVFGASQLAETFRLSPLVIGLTIVAFGTSAPEIGVSLVGAWRGEGSLVVGNIIGSNIFNILLVLGICATITPLVVRKKLIWWDVPIMILASLLFWAFTANGSLGRVEGAVLFAGIIAYLIFACFSLKKTDPKRGQGISHPIWLQCVWIVLGLGLLAYSADGVISNATKMAHYFGISELFIGLTVVAVGTSLPELVTTLVALHKGERDMAVGNVIGSNLFNLLAVMGIAGILSPTPIEVPTKALGFDIPVMVGVALATLPIFLTGHLISRWEGLLFLLYYVIYMLYLFLTPHALPHFTTAVLFFILPLTVLSLGVGLIRHYKKN